MPGMGLGQSHIPGRSRPQPTLLATKGPLYGVPEATYEPIEFQLPVGKLLVPDRFVLYTVLKPPLPEQRVVPLPLVGLVGIDKAEGAFSRGSGCRAHWQE